MTDANLSWLDVHAAQLINEPPEEDPVVKRVIKTGRRDTGFEVKGACPRGGAHNYVDHVEREPDRPFRVTKVTVVCTKCKDSYSSK